MTELKRCLGLIAVGALVAGCASNPPAAQTTANKAAWPVIYEPGLAAAEQQTQARYEMLFEYASVSLGQGAENRDPVKSIAANINQALLQNPQLVVMIKGFASSENGAERAKTTALYRAQSVYYKLARAGVPKSVMSYQPVVLAADASEQARKAIVSW